MTAQVSILNKNAVVLATDSAVTVGNRYGRKVFNTAEKLFELVRNKPVGIMIYNESEFNGVPWEILIKKFKKEQADAAYATLEEYVEAFLDFLRTDELFNDEDGEFVGVWTIADEICAMIFEAINSKLEKAEVLNEEFVLTTLRDTVDDAIHDFQDAGLYEEFRELIENDYLKKYRADIEDTISRRVQMNITDEDYDRLVLAIECGIYSNYMGRYYTGLVFAGYGEEEYFPRLREVRLFLSLGGQLKLERGSNLTIGKIRSDTESTAVLQAFAQRDMVDTFVRGIDPRLDRFTQNLFSDIVDEFYEQSINLLGDDVAESLQQIKNDVEKRAYDAFEKAKWENFVSPIAGMIDTLGKQQLAEMAETLINLTSFKRKMSMDSETVGGPVDIAVISKQEGFVWIKRKYYFDKELNPAYVERRQDG